MHSAKSGPLKQKENKKKRKQNLDEINYEYGVCHQRNFIHKCDLEEESILNKICNLHNRGMSSVKLFLR